MATWEHRIEHISLLAIFGDIQALKCFLCTRTDQKGQSSKKNTCRKPNGAHENDATVLVKCVIVAEGSFVF
jgi:hypothetical protein